MKSGGKPSTSIIPHFKFVSCDSQIQLRSATDWKLDKFRTGSAATSQRLTTRNNAFERLSRSITWISGC